MQTNATTKLQAGPRVSVANLTVEVVDGPDQGLLAETEDEHLTVGTASGNFLRLADPTVSRYHLQLRRSDEGILLEDLGSTNGTACGDIKLIRATIPKGACIQVGNTRLRISDGPGGSVELLAGNRFGDILGNSASMRRLLAQLCRLASTEVAVLVHGESGTGKELVARALHENGPRAKAPLVTVDCGALSPNLVASELFGHEKGAFTGAERQHIGAFERAHQGTLFLDEIGELPAELQPQLLGALERKRFQRVGGTTEIEVDVRVVAATNRDLRQEVNRGSFRMDLYYRLAIVTLTVPPLRERLEDLSLLASHFVKLAGYESTAEEVLSQEQFAQLNGHRWPGNVRELKNWIEATLAMGESPELGDGLSRDTQSPAQLLDRPYRVVRAEVLHEFEQRYCTRLLERCDGNISRAARQARMDRSYLIKLAQRHGLK